MGYEECVRACRLEDLVAPVAKTCADQKIARKWQMFGITLADVQARYTDGTEPTLEQALAGQAVSQGTLMRLMLMRMLEKQKKGPS